MADLPTTAVSLDRLQALVEEFITPLGGLLGRFARVGNRFYSYQVVTRAIQRLRLDLLKGAALTPAGARFAACAAAYLAFLALHSWRRRGFGVEALVTYGSGTEAEGDDERIMVGAFRQRDGDEERYVHDVHADVTGFLLRPPQMLPTLHGRYYALTSLNLPEPEYLYLYGLFLLHSAMAAGNWPTGERVGGIDEDFAAARNLLVDDLHADVGLPHDDERLRQLSWWVVFPPYGWDMNDGQEYNMMTLVDQILHKRVLPLADAESYLRALLESQATHLRYLAARTLLVLGKGPASAAETIHFQGALQASDMAHAMPAMTRFAWLAEGRASDTSPPPEWVERRRQIWQRMVANGPTEVWRRSPLLRDPDYLAAATPGLDPAEQRARLDALLARRPGDWFLETALGALLMSGEAPADVQRGEEILRRAVATTPDCPTAHLPLGTHLKYQGRRDEAMAVFEDGVRRWPWHSQLVDCCLWMVTDGMTAPTAA